MSTALHPRPEARPPSATAAQPASSAGSRIAVAAGALLVAAAALAVAAEALVARRRGRQSRVGAVAVATVGGVGDARRAASDRLGDWRSGVADALGDLGARAGDRVDDLRSGVRDRVQRSRDAVADRARAVAGGVGAALRRRPPLRVRPASPRRARSAPPVAPQPRPPVGDPVAAGAATARERGAVSEAVPADAISEELRRARAARLALSLIAGAGEVAARFAGRYVLLAGAGPKRAAELAAAAVEEASMGEALAAGVAAFPRHARGAEDLARLADRAAERAAATSSPVVVADAGWAAEEAHHQLGRA